MKSLVIPLPAAPSVGEALERALAGDPTPGRQPTDDPFGRPAEADLVLAALPPDDDLPATLDCLGRRFPHARIAGCEAVTQFAGDGLTTAGSLHLFRFEGSEAGVDLIAFRNGGPGAQDTGPGHTDPGQTGAEVAAGGAVASATDSPNEEERMAALVRRLASGDPVLLLVDGLRCAVHPRLARLREALREALRETLGETSREPLREPRRESPLDPGRRATAPPPLAGGLASLELEEGEVPAQCGPAQDGPRRSSPPAAADGGPRPPFPPRGARVFRGRTVLDGGCVAVVFRGVDAEVRVVRGWEPASPVYRVTRARDHVLYEIDGEPASDWFRRFFTVGGDLAPLPATAHRFPLIVEGPAPSRHGLYRSMRSFDDPPGAVTFWGDLETGDRIRLGMGNPESLVDKAAREVAQSGTGAPPEAAILYSCVGRQQVLGDGAGEEVRAVHRALGGIPLSGFFSFGEIGPTQAGGPAFYNHTAILVVLTERVASPRRDLTPEARR